MTWVRAGAVINGCVSGLSTVRTKALAQVRGNVRTHIHQNCPLILIKKKIYTKALFSHRPQHIGWSQTFNQLEFNTWNTLLHFCPLFQKNLKNQMVYNSLVVSCGHYFHFYRFKQEARGNLYRENMNGEWQCRCLRRTELERRRCKV